LNVSTLQQHLGDLARLLRSAQSAKFAGELEAVVSAFEPFRNLALNDFTAFLLRADEFARTGKVTVKAPKGRSPRAPAAPKAPKASPHQMIETTKRLFDRAGSASVSDSELEQLVNQLATLNKDGVMQVAAAIDLSLKKSTNKPTCIEEIRRRILERQGSKLRSQMIHPHPEAATTNEQMPVDLSPTSPSAMAN
jgi:hypothetical protein